MSYEWMKELENEENNKEFSQLTHDYTKLASMRVLQFLREKYKVPPEEIKILTISIFARMLNEAIYAVGAQIREGYSITDIYSKEHLLNLVKVLNGEPLSQFDRQDIDMDIQEGLKKFRKFIIENASDFYLQD